MGCLNKNESYTFQILDKFSDGICCKEGNGSYAGFLDEIPIFSGGDFKESENQTFTTFPPSWEPSSDPTADPTFSLTWETPTSQPSQSPFNDSPPTKDDGCTDNKSFRYKNEKKKKCKWIKKETKLKCSNGVQKHAQQLWIWMYVPHQCKKR